jgi:hypothetical protein
MKQDGNNKTSYVKYIQNWIKKYVYGEQKV